MAHPRGAYDKIEKEVADLACALGVEEMEHERYGAALHAVEQEMKITRPDERLIRVAMGGHAAVGNPDGAGGANKHLNTLIEEVLESVDCIADETRTLNLSLTRRRRGIR